MKQANTFVVCNGNHEWVMPRKEFPTREKAEIWRKTLIATRVDDGFLHVVEKINFGKEQGK